MPHPKWKFYAAKIILRVGDSAKVYNSTFRLKGVPLLYVPKAPPAVERIGMQTGFLISTAGYGSKGYTAREGFYWAVSRTMDATLGGQYMSRRGWSLIDNFRARPSEKAFLNVNYFQVFDRGIQGVNQGGEDVKLNGQTTFAHDVRGVISLEYLSRYVFRTAFAETFTQAVDSEVRSTAFVTKSVHAFSFNGFASRYQNFQSTNPCDVITILHPPSVEVASVEQSVLGTRVVVGYDVATVSLHRSDPGRVMHALPARVGDGDDVRLGRVGD